MQKVILHANQKTNSTFTFLISQQNQSLNGNLHVHTDTRVTAHRSTFRDPQTSPQNTHLSR